jgi:tetratricopeptide (TPR) repeat protein
MSRGALSRDAQATVVGGGTMRAIQRVLLLFVCLIALEVATPANAGTLFDEDGAIARAVSQIREKAGGADMRVFSINVGDNAVSLVAQDTHDRSTLVAWDYTRDRRLLFLRESVAAPRPAYANITEAQLAANLFGLDSVNIGAASKLIAAAAGRAHFAGPGHVTGIEIKLAAATMDRHAGDARWTISLMHENERAEIYARADGTITGANIGETRYARAIDMTSAPEQLVAAAHALADLVGSGDKLTKVVIQKADIAISTNLPDTDRTVMVSGKPASPRIKFNWSASGMRQVLPTFMIVIDQTDTPAFAVDAIDWTMLPRLEDAARQRLDMPGGKVAEVTIGKPAQSVAVPEVLWTVSITDANGEPGNVVFDAQGNVKDVVLPPSRRQAIDWRDSRTLVASFERIGREFGADAQYAGITASQSKVDITARDPRQKDTFASVILNENGFSRFGMPWIAGLRTGRFTLADLAPLTAEKLASLEARALERMRMPPDSIAAIEIGRGGMDPSPNGNVVITIRAEVRPPMGPSGRIVYELDGTVVKVYMPEAMSLTPPPPNPASYAGAYMSCADFSDLDRVIASCTRVIGDPKASADDRGYAFTNRGMAYGRKRDWDRDLADETEAIKLSPIVEQGYTNRGLAYWNKGDFDRAIADFNQAVRLAPTLALAYSNRGGVYLDKGDIAHAISDADEAIRLDPDALSPLHTRGAANLAKGALDAAIADYTAALRINDNDLRSYAGRAQVYLMMRDYQRAIADDDAWAQRAPRDPNAVFSRGRALVYSGDMMKARADFRAAGALSPNYAYAALWLAMGEIRAGLPNRAMELSQPFDAKAWPAPVFRLFADELTRADLVAAASDPDARTQRNQVCEANFYAGEQALARQHKDEAARLFRLAAGDCPRTYIEMEGAQAELAGIAAEH